MKPIACILLGLLVSIGCAQPDAEEMPTAQQSVAAASLTFQEVPSPAAPGSGLPHLYAGADGQVWLSWVEVLGEGHAALRFAQRQDTAWSTPKTIAEGDDWFVNWADFPSLIALGDGVMAAHYLQKSAESTYAYDVRLTQSADGGATWSNALTPHDDDTQTEHGFVSMLPWDGDQVLAVWLDGRNTGGGHGGAMTLRAATVGADQSIQNEAELDARICDCCQTSAARTANGAVVAYRDRSDEEIRDISVVRWKDGQWSDPQTVYADDWHIEGCPVNGPAVTADGERVAVAWFTAADDTPRVKLSFSPDEAVTFGEPVMVDDGQPIGRVDVVMLPDGRALVSWVERTDDGAEIRVRRVQADGTAEAAVRVALTSPERASGFPRLVRSGDHLYMAWTEAGDPIQLHTAVAALLE